VESPEGPLVFAAQHHGIRHLVLGFDPFPYLGRQNLPMSILTLNVLDWFFENSGARSRGTGEALFFSAARQGDLIVSPRGDKITLKSTATSFAQTFYQGVYQLNRGRDKELFAVNLQDANESDLHRASPIEFHDRIGANQKASTFFAFWPYLLVAALLLSVVEWFIHPRRLRTAVKTSPNRAVSPYA
jgi:hypothetical protein